MEIKIAACPKTPISYNANTTSSASRAPPPCPSTTLGIPTKSPFHIQYQPLRRPLLKPPVPIPIERNTHISTTTTTTTSDVLRLMDCLNVSIPTDIYVSLTKECTETRNSSEAVELHSHIKRSGLRPSLSLFNRLLLMYVSCGCIEIGRQLFDEMPVKDFISWLVMLAGYMDNGQYEEAIDLFIELQPHCRCQLNGGILRFLVSWTVVSTLKACAETKNLGLGKQIHGWLLKVGYSMGLFLSNSLIAFYGNMGCFDGVDLVFDQVSHQNAAVWTARIVSNRRAERYDEVIDIFKEMGRQGVKKNSSTFSSVLSACGMLKDGGYCGRQIHANAIKLGLESRSYVQCGLVNLYGKCGLVEDARRVFEINGDKRNAACWNAMLTCCIQHGFCIDAIKILYEMKAAGFQPHESLANEVWLVCGSKTFMT